MYTPYKMKGSAFYGKSITPAKNLGFAKAKALKENPNAKTMEVGGKTFPIKKYKTPTMMSHETPTMMSHEAPTAKKGCKKKYRK